MRFNARFPSRFVQGYHVGVARSASVTRLQWAKPIGGRIVSVSKHSGFLHRWGSVPLAVYVCGIALPISIAFLRDTLMFVLGVPLYTALFWTGPFTSVAAVFWSSWTAGWRVTWVLLVPVFIAVIFLALRLFGSEF